MSNEKNSNENQSLKEQIQLTPAITAPPVIINLKKNNWLVRKIMIKNKAK